MRAKIISAFPACGKTYIYNNQERLGLVVSDSDSSKYEKVSGWEVTYVNDIMSKVEDYDYIFISQYPSVLKELNSRGVYFYCVTPNGSDNIDDKTRQLIKQQWFGRFLLRDNSHIRSGFENWLNVLLENYDKWATPSNFDGLTNCKELILLNQDEYLVDVLHKFK